MNAVAVVDVTPGQEAVLKGYIPAGWVFHSPGGGG